MDSASGSGVSPRFLTRNRRRRSGARPRYLEADLESERGRGAAPVLATLNDLLQLDHDAIAAYEIALDRFQSEEHAARVERFLRDHDRHVEALTALILGMGGEPKNEPHATGPLGQALQGLGSLAGDRGTLLALRMNELQARNRYLAAAQATASGPVAVRALIERNLRDEEEHHARLGEMIGRAALPERLADRVKATPAAALLLAFAAGCGAGLLLGFLTGGEDEEEASAQRRLENEIERLQEESDCWDDESPLFPETHHHPVQEEPGTTFADLFTGGLHRLFGGRGSGSR